MSVLVIMGVSGSGKSTIGAALSKTLELPFVEGDDFHPTANVTKMSSGTPLTNEERAAWITLISQHINNHANACILSCSALNKTVRGWLRDQIEAPVTFIYLEGTREMVAERLANRKGHFMKQDMLNSQFAALISPKDALVFSIAATPEEICDQIAHTLNEKR